MKLESLDNIAEIIAGQSPPSDTYNQNGAGLPFFQGKADFGEMYPTVRYWCKIPTKIALPNDILISVRAPVGPVNICNVESCIGRGLSAIRVNNKNSRDYIYYFLKANEKQIAKLGVGSTFTAITQKEVRELKIPIPKKFEDQIKIASLLRKAESLIKQRNKTISLIDDILRSSFLKIFSPFFHKSHIKKLASLCLKITDGTHDTPERLKLGVKFITGKHIRPYVIDFDNSDYVTNDVHKEIYRRCNPEFGDILYTNIGVNLGTAAMNNVDYEFSMKNVALLKINKSLVTSRYIEHLLNLPSRRNRILDNYSSGGAQQFLSLGQIKNIDIPVPPIELQLEFSEIVEKAEILKAQFKSSLLELEKLYGSISQKAFKGELNLNNVHIEENYSGFDGIEVEGNRVSIEPVKTIQKIDEGDEKHVFDIKKYLEDSELKFKNSNDKKLTKEEIKKYFEEEKKKLEQADSHNISQPYGDPFDVDEKTAKEFGAKFYKEWKKLHPKKTKGKLIWENVSTQQVANWIKEKYTGYHFTSEMLIRFLMEEYVTNPHYYSSEELKKYPKANESDDLKTFIQSAIVLDKNNKEELEKANNFIKLEQLFYNAEKENFQLNITEEDYEFIKDRSTKERSGIYFNIIE